MRWYGLALRQAALPDHGDEPGIDRDEVLWAEPCGFERDAQLEQRAILPDHGLLHRWPALLQAADGE
ncbi:MAG: hypothetical protein M3248_02270 [Actinomycetota bacterium]|nr:hypothetical protein [Actinomycetota bacterium]